MSRSPTLLGLAALLLFTLPAGAAWQDELTTAPGKFAPLRPFHATYKFGWALLTAADAEIDLLPTKGGVTRLTAAARTTGAVRLSWRMDTTHSSSIAAATLRPIAMSQTESYKSGKVVTKLNFDAQGVARLRESQPQGENPDKVKRFDFPSIFDLHSALHLIRSQRLQNGDVYKLVVYPGATPYLAQVRVAGRTKVKAAGKTYPAIKLDLQLSKIKSDLSLVPHEKFKKASAYLSDDADRLFLRIESEIFVGSVWGELEKVEFR